jgi:hypothetical protein
MKIYSSYLPIERYEREIGSIERFKDKPISIFNDYVPRDPNEFSMVNLLILNEPNELFGLHTFAKNNYQAFSAIMSWDEEMLGELTNYVLFPHGETNLDLEYINSFETNPKREFGVTFLSGVLAMLEGHKLRQRILDKENEINIPKNWWRTLDDFDHERGQRPGYFETKIGPNGNPIEGDGKKQVWNTNKMFHVAVENSKHKHYFTDKILDCFGTKTLPIYWGAPNMGDWYDERGVIYFNDENELVEIINKLTPDDYYSRLPYIENNYKLVKEQGFFFKRIETYLDKLIAYNKL